MTREELLEQRGGLKAYLLQKAKADDWHAVADAAMDLREVDAQLSILRDEIVNMVLNAEQLAEVMKR